MTWLTLSQIAKMTGGVLHGEDIPVESVSTDSRNAAADQLFIALKGERFDAHDFVADLTGKAGGALVHQLIECDLPQVLVKDTHKALGDFAAAWRKTLSLPVIALTGSNGKTTVKEMLASILSQRGHVIATIGNLNNDIGMPLTLLRMRKEHDFAVIEMGANHFGEIAYLTEIAQPDVAIINNAGAAHLEGFGDIKGVSRAKSEIFAGLSDSGIAIFNGDDDYADYWNEVCEEKRVVTFGLEQGEDVRGELTANGSLLINPHRHGIEVNLKLLGDHNAMNALAATAAAVVVGTSVENIKVGLEKLKPVAGRLAPVEAKRGAIIIDDTYNANPTSMQMGINVLARREGVKILVLGDMGELGGDVAQMHFDIGKQAKASGIDYLFGLGDYSKNACNAFGHNVDETASSSFSDVGALITALDPLVQEKTTILIKGSRAMKMERVVKAYQLDSAGGNAKC